MLKILKELTKPRLTNLGAPQEEPAKISPTQITIRLIISIITATWITSIPFYLFIIFMHENSFFSYDFFTDGVFGLYTFIMVSLLFIFFISAALYGFIFFAKLGLTEQRRSNENPFRAPTWFFFVISGLTHLALFLTTLEKGNVKVFFWITGISFTFSIFLCGLAGHGFKKNIQNWAYPLAFIGATVILPFMYRDITAEIVRMGLHGFNMGGGKTVEISYKNNKESLTGKLTLLSPKNIYLKDKNENLLIIPTSEDIKIKIISPPK